MTDHTWSYFDVGEFDYLIFDNWGSAVWTVTTEIVRPTDTLSMTQPAVTTTITQPQVVLEAL